MATQQYTAKEVADALLKAKGFVSVAARRLACTTATVRNYIGRYETCKQAVYDAKEEMKDFAEGKLYQNIDDNREASLIFYLKTQAKDRGYVERQEVTGAGGSDVIMRVVYDNGIDDTATQAAS